MFLSQGLLTWTLLLSVLAGSVSALQTVNGAVGGSVYLTVDLTLPTPENLQAVWRFNTNSLIVSLSPGNPIIYTATYQERCELLPDLTLRLDKLTLADQGDYTLTVSDLAIGNETTVTVYLAVYKPITITPNLKSNTSSPANGSIVSLHCDAPDQTVETYTFYRNQVNACSQSRVTCAGSNLTFHPIIASDKGNYTCTIQNPINNKTSDPFPLLVTGHPKESIKCSAIGNNQNVHLLCSWADGNPPANINMSFNTSIQSGLNEVVKYVPLNTVYSSEKLVCHGAQGGLEVSCALTLEKPYAADFTNYSTTPVEEGNSVTLTVTLTGNTVGINSRALIPKVQILPANFTWFHLNPNPTPVPEGVKFSAISTPSTSNLTVSTVTESENGTYECRAENMFGSTHFFFIMHVTAGPISLSSKGLAPGEIAGIVIGVLAGLTIIGTIGFFILKAHKTNSTKAHIYENTENQTSHIYVNTMPGAEDLIFQDKAEYSTIIPAPKK
ncbi:carcinoembryonic antigen-related cell adhesion molecule 1-like [Pelobates cultripes]|uniref:Carcinoembryonic antigen-related cell adhesion molecule 1-like n=1 Tax=Pelobates cultripes TaxID=61616 RepID=A0AAD1T8S4_PELCU|nr:carcinoembryonic antigen-related cell adhesion molecule 1-like [Pelobates cultripes]